MRDQRTVSKITTSIVLCCPEIVKLRSWFLGKISSGSRKPSSVTTGRFLQRSSLPYKPVNKDPLLRRSLLEKVDQLISAELVWNTKMGRVQSDTRVGNLQINLDERYREKWTLWRVTEVFHLSTNIRATSTVQRTREHVAVGRKLIQRSDKQSFTWRSRELRNKAQFYFNRIFKLTDIQMQRGLWDGQYVNIPFITPAR